jgi:hypothetical protein
MKVFRRLRFWVCFLEAMILIIIFSFVFFRNKFEMSFRDQANVYPMEIGQNSPLPFVKDGLYELSFRVSDKPLKALSLLLDADASDSSSLVVSVDLASREQSLTFDIPAKMIDSTPLIRLDIAALKAELGSTVRVKIHLAEDLHSSSIGYYRINNAYLNKRPFLARFYHNGRLLDYALIFKPEYSPEQSVTYRLPDAYYDTIIDGYSQASVGFKSLYILIFGGLTLGTALWLYDQSLHQSRKKKFALAVFTYIIIILIMTYPFV